MFLPTAEAAPYPLLINGAFRTDLSRQEVRVGDDESDYNRHLLRATARTFTQQLLPALADEGLEATEILALLDRAAASGSRNGGSAAATLHDAMRAELEHVDFIPGEDGLRLQDPRGCRAASHDGERLRIRLPGGPSGGRDLLRSLVPRR